jgi:cytochrome P450 family 117 subfamily A
MAAPGLPRSPEELKRHPFAEALFREVLRLSPLVAFTGRQAKRPPKGTLLELVRA